MHSAVVDGPGLLAFAVLFGAGEGFATLLIFPWIIRAFNRPAESEGLVTAPDVRARLIGHLERFFLFLTLLLGVHHGLTLFAALKVGSRLDEERKNEVKTEYFLAGNTVSVTLALLYYQAFPILRGLIAAALFRG